MQIKFKKLTNTAKTPTRATNGSAGYDLYVDADKPIIINPHKTARLTTGIAMEIPQGYFGAVYSRSGIATKRNLRLPNCVGVIDSDYRGNIGVSLINDSDIQQQIDAYERIAQIVIQPHLDVEFIEDSLSDTERGTGGYGSTGKA